MESSRSTYFSKKVVFLNVVATILIVLLHSETPVRWGMPLDGEHFPFIWAVYVLTQIAVPLFFFISALLFYRDCEWKDIPKKLYRRIFSLLIPFVIWNLFFVIVYWALGKIPFTADKMAQGVALDTPLQWIDAVWNTRFTPLWFVKYLIYFCLLSPVVLLLIKNRWVGIAAAIAFAAASVILKWEGMTDLAYWAPVYIAGALTGRYLYNGEKDENVRLFSCSGKTTRIWLTVAFMAVIVSAYAFALLSEDNWIALRYLCPVAVWMVFDLLVPDDFRERFTVKKWMGYTFFIYATHHFLLNVEQTLVRAYLPGTPAVLNLTFVITPIITLFIIILTAAFLSRFKFYKLLTGGR